jgi:hypothetical protein
MQIIFNQYYNSGDQVVQEFDFEAPPSNTVSGNVLHFLGVHRIQNDTVNYRVEVANLPVDYYITPYQLCVEIIRPPATLADMKVVDSDGAVNADGIVLACDINGYKNFFAKVNITLRVNKVQA